jgi:hypothetical protein
MIRSVPALGRLRVSDVRSLGPGRTGSWRCFRGRSAILPARC